MTSTDPGSERPRREMLARLVGGPAGGRQALLRLHLGQPQTSLYVMLLDDEVLVVGQSVDRLALERAGQAERAGLAHWARYDLVHEDRDDFEFHELVRPTWAS